MALQPLPRLSTLGVAFEARFEQHLSTFQQRTSGLGSGPVRLFFAPGRINLMGAHLDYNGGPVMPMAIDRGTFVALRPRHDGLLRLASSSEPQEACFDLATFGNGFPAPSGCWWDYPMGVLRALSPKNALRGADIYLGGDLPVGAGLSSSASVNLAMALALDAHFDLGLDVQGGVDAALDAEREYVGVQCGIMDPYAVGHARPGHVLVLDCATQKAEHVLLDPDLYTVGIVDTGVRRELASGEFNRRVEQCGEAFEQLRPFAEHATNLASVPLRVLEEREAKLPAVLARRARHVIEETQRTLKARDALVAGDVASFGAEMFAAHTSLRDLFEVSIPELDLLVDEAANLDCVLGSRLTGAGFGGCIAAILKTGEQQVFTEALTASFESHFGKQPQVAFYRGSPGLGEVKLEQPAER